MGQRLNYILVIVLLVSFIIRLNRLDYPLSDVFAWGDGTRDYLVASHIVKYNQIPLIGPINLLEDSGIKNSPLYFYILALPLIFFNHPLTLGVFNLILAMAVLVLVYMIARTLFNQKVALMALVLFAFNPQVIKQSDYIWQPYLMQPVALLSFYFLINKKLLASLVVISFAFALHNSVFPWLALFLTVCFLTFKKEKKSFKYFSSAAFVVVLTLIITYLPVILSRGLLSLDVSLPAQNISGYLNNLNLNIDVFLNTFYVKP